MAKKWAPRSTWRVDARPDGWTVLPRPGEEATYAAARPHPQVTDPTAPRKRPSAGAATTVDG